MEKGNSGNYYGLDYDVQKKKLKDAEQPMKAALQSE